MNKLKFISMIASVLIWTWIVTSAAKNMSSMATIASAFIGGAVIGLLHAVFFKDKSTTTE